MILHATLPPPLRSGARVGVAALSGPVDGASLERGLAALRDLGFQPVVAENIDSRSGLFAGGDEERLEAFHRLAADPSVEAIFFARGGHGILRILPAIDWSLLATRPRAYVGYSDLTPFLLEVVRRLGLVAFHGPMVAADFARGLEGEEARSLIGALVGDYPAALPLGGWFREGTATGPLLGGCLSLLATTQGTPFAPPLEGALLFWEDWNEPLYRIDRMLTHLKLSGSLASIRGMVIGHVGLTDWSGGEEEWLPEIAGGFVGQSWPVAWGLKAGHDVPNLTLPLGLPARLDGATKALILGES